MSKFVRVAAVQASPVLNDLPRCLEKTKTLIQEAAAQGAELVAFPESWLPGYPAWLDCCRDVAVWDHEALKSVYARLVSNSVPVPGPETSDLCGLAKEFGVDVNIGVHERVAEGPGHGTLYNAMLTIDRDGVLRNHHRKIMPTFTERMIWGQGDGSGLHAVNTTSARIGGLICWEHWMPLARHTLHVSREEIHVAAWPWVKEMNLVASRHYAFEGRCFVIACGAILRAGDLPAELELVPSLQGKPDELVLRGGSAIIGPDGSIIAGPVFEKETTIVSEIDLSSIVRENLALDVTGHYARPDIFDVLLKTPKS